MNFSVLFRKDPDNHEEYEVCRKTAESYNISVVLQRSEVPKGSLVIGRYSVLPYYNELQKDLEYNNSSIVNSFDEHKWIANFEYYNVLKDCTFETWRIHEMPYLDYDGPFVVKGCTNSKKHKWNTSMFAQDKKKAIEIYNDLKSDMLICSQEILFRKYEPLKTFEVGVNGMRFANEWRFFCLGNKILSFGFYWTCAEDAEKINEKGPKASCVRLAQEIANKASSFANFYVLDIAEKENGDWVLVEVNDGQMSGLSMNDPQDFYASLFYALPSFVKDGHKPISN